MMLHTKFNRRTMCWGTSVIAAFAFAVTGCGLATNSAVDPNVSPSVPSYQDQQLWSIGPSSTADGTATIEGFYGNLGATIILRTGKGSSQITAMTFLPSNYISGDPGDLAFFPIVVPQTSWTGSVASNGNTPATLTITGPGNSSQPRQSGDLSATLPVTVTAGNVTTTIPAMSVQKLDRAGMKLFNETASSDGSLFLSGFLQLQGLDQGRIPTISGYMLFESGQTLSPAIVTSAGFALDRGAWVINANLLVFDGTPGGSNIPMQYIWGSPNGLESGGDLMVTWHGTQEFFSTS